MKEKMYTGEIAIAIKNFLKEEDWNFSFDEQRGIFKFGLYLKGKLKKISYIVDVKEDDYVVYAISPIGADVEDEKMMTTMSEFICRVNYGLNTGNFEFDFRDGEIRFKVYINCNGIIPTIEMIKHSIYCPAEMFRMYGSGIIDIIFNNGNAKEVFGQCENSRENKIRSLIAQLIDDNEDSDMESMLARLVARFSSDDESAEDSEQSSENVAELEVHTDPFENKGGVA